MKQRIILNESQLNKLVTKAVKKALNEIKYTLAGKSYDKISNLGQDKRAREFEKTFQNLRNNDRIQWDLENRDLKLKGDNNVWYYVGVTEEGKLRWYRDGNWTDYGPRTSDRRLAIQFTEAVKEWLERKNPELVDKINKNMFIA